MKGNFSLIYSLCIFILCLNSTASLSQKQFFKAGPALTSDQLSDFHASFTIENGKIYFIASDYFIYAFDKASGKKLWDHSLNYKTSIPCFVSGGMVYVPYYKEKHSYTAQLDAETGDFIKLLPMDPLQTTPVEKEDILYGTAIIDGGSVFAYDIKNDSLLWSRFVAHGVSTQPYFFPEYIYTNAESDHWFRLGYKGQLLDTTCKNKASIFVSDIPCVRNFLVLTHDGAELTGKFLEKSFGDDALITPGNTLRGPNRSFVLYEDNLAIIGKKGKLEELVNLPVFLQDHIPGEEPGLRQLVTADEKTVSFTWLNFFIRYNFKSRKIEKQVNLSAWDPSQVVLENDNIWLISRKDGMLYGLALDDDPR